MFRLLDSIVVLAVFGVFVTVSEAVTQCYYCNSQFCGTNYDTRLGSIASCSDVYKNTRLYSGRIVASEESSGLLKSNEGNLEGPPVGSDNSEDIETLSVQDSNNVIGNRTSARIFDIQRKIWELFNKGEINENTQFVCVKAIYSSGGQTKTYRGCVPRSTPTISTACDFVNTRVDGASAGNVYACYTCETNLCNSGISLKTSVLALVVGILLKIMV